MAHFIGLDVGSFSIKVVALAKKGKGFKLEALGIALNPLGARPGADETSQIKVAEAVKKLLSEARSPSRKAVLALSESQVYTKVVEMPVLTDSELASAIHWEAEQYIPIPIDQVNVDYEVVSRPDKASPSDKMQVLLVAAPRATVARTVEFATRCDLEMEGLETEMLAVSRAMIPDSMSLGPTMLVHMGASSTDVAILKGGMPVLAHSMDSGGTSLTRVLANELGLDFSQAEEYKRSYGLDPSQLEGKVRQSLLPLVDRWLLDLKKAVSYYNSSNKEQPLARVLLSGGSALLPGLVAYMAEVLGAEVVLGNAFALVEPSNKVPIPPDTVSFATAVGLAMKEV